MWQERQLGFRRPGTLRNKALGITSSPMQTQLSNDCELHGDGVGLATLGARQPSFYGFLQNDAPSTA